MRRSHGLIGAAAAAALLAGACCTSAKVPAGITGLPMAPLLLTCGKSVPAVSIAPDGRVWAATSGGLAEWDATGRLASVRTDPEIAWRDVAADGQGGVAAIGLRHVAWRDAAGWHSLALPAGVEGHAIATAAGRWWFGCSDRILALRDGGLQEVAPQGAARLVGDAKGVWAIGTAGILRIVPHTASARLSLPPGLQPPLAAAAWQGKLALAGAPGRGKLEVWVVGVGRAQALPALPGPGSHVAALAADGTSLLAAAAGGGLWRWNCRRWSAVPGAPGGIASLACRGARILNKQQEVVVLSPSPRSVGRCANVARRKERLLPATCVAGTWSDGIRMLSGGRWASLPDPGTLPAGNIQALALYRGQAVASTFDRGLLLGEYMPGAGFRWRSVRAPQLSGDSPRQMAVSGGHLLVRQASGRVDLFDGQAWERDILRRVSHRPWCASLAADGERLAAGGWGAVNLRVDGTWRMVPLPEPWSKEIATAVAWEGNALLLGSYHHGAARFDPETRRLTPLPGGPDDLWITALEASEGQALAGTFNAGVALWQGREPGRCELLPGPVTAACVLPAGPAVAATRAGVWVHGEGAWQELPVAPSLEPQALLATEEGVWVGGRCGIAYQPWPGRMAQAAP